MVHSAWCQYHHNRKTQFLIPVFGYAGPDGQQTCNLYLIKKNKTDTWPGPVDLPVAVGTDNLHVAFKSKALWEYVPESLGVWDRFNSVAAAAPASSVVGGPSEATPRNSIDAYYNSSRKRKAAPAANDSVTPADPKKEMSMMELCAMEMPTDEAAETLAAASECRALFPRTCDAPENA